MLTISKPLSAGQAQTYHAKEFTAPEQNSVSLTALVGGDDRVRQAHREAVNISRRGHTTYGLDGLNDPLGPTGSSSILGLHAVSPEFLRRPKRWPASHRITGSFFFDEPWKGDSALERFIACGDPPVVICFGSMLHEAPDDLATIVLSAITRAGKRAVVQKGWTGLHVHAKNSENIHIVDFVPHWWLFPKAGTVVHAGGAGTTAATLRSGIPSVVVPPILDQFLWATLLKERGCASDVIPFGELTAQRLGTAIERAADPTYWSSAASFSRIIRAEDGTSRAVDLIGSQIEAKSSCDLRLVPL